MPIDDTTHEQDEYRLVLVRSGSDAIWAKRDGSALLLPRITIPRWMRPAEQLQLAIEAGWHLRTIVLDFLPSKTGSAPGAVVEILPSEADAGLAAASIDEITEMDIDPEERETVKAILAGDAGARGPFSRVGWIQEAMEWMRAEMGKGIVFTGEVRQLNGGGSFALLRFETQAGPACWLKATGEPNVHEFHITRMLADLCPEFLPHRVAEREDWNAWLTEDAGQPLDSWTLPALERAVLSMADLQKRTIGRTDAFLAAGAFDQRMYILRSHLGELFEYLDEAMAKQVSTRVPRIGRRRLLEMAGVLLDACLAMEALDIPDALVLNDLNSGSILFKGAQCVFTDWCEAGIGNPFFAFHYLCRLDSQGAECRSLTLREIYKPVWFDCLSASQIDRAFVLMPLLATLTYLYGRGTWLYSTRRNDPHVESFVRSLARHMDRAATNSRLLEAICH